MLYSGVDDGTRVKEGLTDGEATRIDLLSLHFYSVGNDSPLLMTRDELGRITQLDSEPLSILTGNSSSGILLAASGSELFRTCPK